MCSSVLLSMKVFSACANFLCKRSSQFRTQVSAYFASSAVKLSPPFLALCVSPRSLRLCGKVLFPAFLPARASLLPLFASVKSVFICVHLWCFFAFALVAAPPLCVHSWFSTGGAPRNGRCKISGCFSVQWPVLVSHVAE